MDDAFREFSCDTTNNGYEVNRHMETNPVLDDGEHWQLLAPALDEPGPYYLIITGFIPDARAVAMISLVS